MSREEKVMYNPEIKEEYLSTLNESTANIYKYAFYRSFETEDTLNKDLYSFTADQIKDCLVSANHTTLDGVKLTYNIFKSYIDWAVRYRESNINQATLIKEEELKTFIDTSRKLYFSEKELDDLINKLTNAQDAVILQLIFEGVNGYQSTEILNLTEKDVNFDTGELSLRDDKYGERVHKVSDKALRLISSAIKQDEYQLRNGESEGKNNSYPLISNDYIVRNIARSSKNASGSADRHLLYRRLTVISELFDLPYITVKNIEKSGMIKLAKEVFERDGKLEKEQIWEVADKFGVRRNAVGSHNTRILSNFINIDNVSELYEINK